MTMYAWSTRTIGSTTYRDITSLADLNAIGNGMPAGTTAEKEESMGFNYYLVNDIDCGGGTVNMIKSPTDAPYTGIFDLNGKTISNGSITGPTGSHRAFIYRLAGNLYNGKIALNVTALSDLRAAGITIFLTGSIIGVAFAGNVTATSGTLGVAAGLVHTASGGTGIINCYMSGNVTADNAVSGIVYSQSYGGEYVGRCYFSGTLSGSPRAGIASGSGLFDNNFVDITKNTNVTLTGATGLTTAQMQSATGAILGLNTSTQEYAFPASSYPKLVFELGTLTATFSGGGGTPSSQTKACTYQTAIGALPATPTRSGYIFNGWHLNGTQITASTIYYWPDNMTFTATWRAQASYEFTFDANGGSGTQAFISSATIPDAPLCTFQRSGYAFSHWNTLANGTGTSYLVGASLPTSGTLYAIWVVSSKSVIDFGNGVTTGVNCRLVDYEGILSAEPELFYKEYAIVDGGTSSGGRINTRRITVTLDFGQANEYRQIKRLFRLNQTYRLTVSRGGITAYIDGIIDSPIVEVEKGYGRFTVVQISFLCMYPYFTSTGGQLTTSVISGNTLTTSTDAKTGAEITFTASASYANLIITSGGKSLTVGSVTSGQAVSINSITKVVTVATVARAIYSYSNYPFVYGDDLIRLYNGATEVFETLTIKYTPIYEGI